MDSFVYCWTDRATAKLYVGLHKGRTDDGYVCSSKHMLKAYEARPSDFSREILTVNTYDVCRTFEAAIIRAMFAQNVSCYNLNVAGAIRYTEEIRKKISRTHKNKTISEAHRVAIREWNANKRSPASQETKDKIRQKKLGVKRAPFSEEWKARIAAGMKKRVNPPEFGLAITARQLGSKRGPLTEAHKDKLRQASTGKKHTVETVAKLKEAKATVSDDTRKKLSEAKKAYWAKKKGASDAP
jgi:hypothetical protein